VIHHVEKKLQVRRSLQALVVTLPLTLFATATNAAYNVSISMAATSNGSLSGGVFTPTGNGAVLNVTDLETALATSSVTVTTGTGGSQNGNITVSAKVSWSANTLTLDAFKSVSLNKSLKATATAGLAVVTDDGGSGGSFSTGSSKVTFGSTSQSLTINGTSYTLVSSLPSLATDISGNPHGSFALIGNYDATVDGTYTTSPIPTSFYGTFEGLGNQIQNFTLTVTSGGHAMFDQLMSTGAVRDFALTNAFISAAAPLILNNSGTVTNSSVTGSGTPDAGLVSSNVGTITGSSSTLNASAGGLVLANNGTISQSWSSGNVGSSTATTAGGIAYSNPTGSIFQCFATGSVTAHDNAGGLVGSNNGGSINQSYATGAVTSSSSTNAGGLVGENSGQIFNSYALGSVTHGTDVGSLVGINFVGGVIGTSYGAGALTTTGTVGGFVGYDQTSAGISSSYWDTTTTGITNTSQGAGNIANDPGITGLSDSVLKSGLPSGFSSSTWGQSATINGGLPYLLAIPPS
jgi:hypothetical protein